MESIQVLNLSVVFSFNRLLLEADSLSIVYGTKISLYYSILGNKSIIIHRNIHNVNLKEYKSIVIVTYGGVK